MRRVVFVLALTACGRFGFDDISGLTDAHPGADGPAQFDVTSSGCTAAQAGPFTAVAHFPTQGGGYGVWARPPYVLEADTTGGLHSLRFDGSSFTEVVSRNDLGWVEDIVSDGTYFYIGSPGFGLTVFELGAAGSLIQRAQDTTITEARHAWFSNGLVYVPAGGDGIFATRFDGTSIQHVGTKIASMGWSEAAFAQGAFIYFADENYFRVLAFNGSTFADAVTPNNTHPGSNRVWPIGNQLFVSNQDGVTAYAFDGATLAELDTFTIAPSSRSRDVWSDGVHVFIAAEADGIYALSFSGGHFTLVDHVVTPDALGVFGDGTYIYSNDLTDGLTAYRGFACTQF